MSAGVTNSAQAPSVPSTSGSAPTRLGHDGRAAGHRLHRRQREPFVERRYARDFGGGEQRGELVVGQPAGDVDDVGDAQFRNELVRLARSARPGRPAEAPDRAAARNLATACSSVATPLSGMSALAIAMTRPGDGARRRFEQCRVHTQWNDVQLIRGHAEVGRDVGRRRRRHRQQLRESAVRPAAASSGSHTTGAPTVFATSAPRPDPVCDHG